MNVLGDNVLQFVPHMMMYLLYVTMRETILAENVNKSMDRQEFFIMVEKWTTTWADTYKTLVPFGDKYDVVKQPRNVNDPWSYFTDRFFEMENVEEGMRDILNITLIEPIS